MKKQSNKSNSYSGKKNRKRKAKENNSYKFKHEIFLLRKITYSSKTPKDKQIFTQKSVQTRLQEAYEIAHKRDNTSIPTQEEMRFAITNPINNKTISIDTIIAQLYEQEQDTLEKTHYIAYIGNGKFAIVAPDKTSTSSDAITIIRLLNTPEYTTYETPAWALCLRINIQDYDPNPTPITMLYNHDEIRSFTKLGAQLLSTLPLPSRI